MSAEIVPAGAPAVGLPSETRARLEQANQTIAHGSIGDLVDVLIYTDALVSVAREKRAAEIAREAARTRINAIRKMGELVVSTKDDDQRERLWQVIPNRFLRCEEIAQIPARLFDKVTKELVDNDTSCSIPNVLRRARIDSLRRVEDGIYVAYDESYWIAEKGKKRTHIHYGGIEEARRRIGLRNHPGARRIDEAFSHARMAASTLSQLGTGFTGEARRLIGEAELAQAKVAELLDRALREIVT